MSAEGRLAKTRRLAKRIEEEIIRAIALHGILACLGENPDLIGPIQRQAWFPLIRDSIQTDLLMTLCRMHEHGGEENAAIPIVVGRGSIYIARTVRGRPRFLASPVRQGKIEPRSRRRDPGLEELGGMT